LEKLAKNEKEFILICGHYEGIDNRIMDLFDIKEISI
jgi:tRNA (guanine-N1)-methyltransferase